MAASDASDGRLTASAGPSDPAPELQIARDMVRRGLPLAAAAVLVAGAVWGASGAASAGFAVGLVLLNFVVSAWLLATTARISYALLMATALFGYLLRLALIGAAVFAVKDAAWVEPMALGLTIVVTHLGLLVWELRYVSASLAYPGLKPATKEIAPR